MGTVAVYFGSCEVEHGAGHHHHHHKKHHHKRSAREQQSVTTHTAVSQSAENHLNDEVEDTMSAIKMKMKKLENDLASQELSKVGFVKRSILHVKGPLPANFNERFQQAAASAVSCDPSEIRVTDIYSLNRKDDVVELVFNAPAQIANSIEKQASDSESNFTKGDMHDFVVKNNPPDTSVQKEGTPSQNDHTLLSLATASVGEQKAVDEVAHGEPNQDIDVDTDMPYGELEPFGREDTAQELTESSIKESDEMVDQLERAEVAEEKRAVFRALTRLRGAAITSFDGVARSQTGNIDEYNKVHKWRSTHPLRHLASEEADVSKWAFPDSADF